MTEKCLQPGCRNVNREMDDSHTNWTMAPQISPAEILRLQKLSHRKIHASAINQPTCMPLLPFRGLFCLVSGLYSPLYFARIQQRYRFPTEKSTLATMSPPPTKRQKRIAETEAATQLQNDGNSTTGEVKMPKKKFYRQRAHANPFSDHRLD